MQKTNESQAGFRQGYSTVDNIFILQSLVQRFLGIKGRKMYGLFVDFRKAFDSIQRDKLWTLLDQHDVSDKMKNLLRSIYENVKVCVRSNNEMSESFSSNIGVRQGCILSPFLFSFFINEFATLVEQNGTHGIQLHPDVIQLFLLLFADDIVLFSHSIVGLQHQIYELETYCEESGLTVNMDKTKVMVFKNGGNLAKSEKWYYQGKALATTSLYKYLGVYFSSNLSWSAHTNQASVQAKKILVGIYKNMQVLGNIKYNIFFKIFDTKILPILLYGSEMWGFQSFDAIEKVQLFACKKFLGVKINTPSNMVYGECGRFPIHIFSQIKIIKYWLRLLNMPNHRYPKKCYNMMVLYDTNGKTNWVSNLRKLLCNTGHAYAWNDQRIDFPAQFILSVTQRLKDIYLQQWNMSLSITSKCSLYKLVKTHIYVYMYRE